MKFFFIYILLFSLPFKSCRNDQPVYIEPTGVEKDSAELAQDTILSLETIENNKIVSTGKIGGYVFAGKSRKITNIDMMLENGMEMLMNNDQYAEMKLFDDKHGITVSVRIIDLELFNKIPFSYTFSEGKKLIITVFIKNKQGVNEMYGGTIRNMKGRISITGINRSANTLIGSLDAELTNVLDLNSKCKIEEVRFINAGFFYSQKNRAKDTAFIRNKNGTITQ